MTVPNRYLWTFPKAIRATLSWKQHEPTPMLSLLIENRDSTKPLPVGGALMCPTMDVRDVVPESPTLDDDSVVTWAEECLARFYLPTRRKHVSERVLAEWDLAPRPESAT